MNEIRRQNIEAIKQEIKEAEAIKKLCLQNQKHKEAIEADNKIHKLNKHLDELMFPGGIF